MRKDHGWYPSFLEPKDVAPRDAPADWIFEAADFIFIGADLGTEQERVITVKVGDEVPFDYWHAVGTAIVGIGTDGKPAMIQGEEPAKYDSVWNPRDTEAREWPTLKGLMGAWNKERGKWAERVRVEQDAIDEPAPYTTMAVEFIVWERGRVFRIGAGLSAEEMTK